MDSKSERISYGAERKNLGQYTCRPIINNTDFNVAWQMYVVL